MTKEELKNIVKDKYEIDVYPEYERIYVNKFLHSFSKYLITYEEINGVAFLTDKGETHNRLTAIEDNVFITACNKYNLNFTNNVISKQFESINDLESFISALDDISNVGHLRYEQALEILHQNYETYSHGYGKNYIRINKELTFGTFYSLLLANHLGEPIITDWHDTVYYLHKLDINVFVDVCKKYDIDFSQGTMERKFKSNQDVEIFLKAIDELVEMHENLDED